MNCSVSNCDKLAYRANFCRPHYRKTLNNCAETPEYSSWNNMNARCYNPNNNRYNIYATRGITVCDEWRHDFQRFLKDMGKRPSIKHSLDRINNNGNYEPSNCRWATAHQQTANRRSNTNVVGIHYDKFCNRWFAILQVNRKYVLRRNFKTKEEAIAARKAAEIEYLGAIIQP